MNPAADANWDLKDLVRLLKKLGFNETKDGSGKKKGTSHKKYRSAKVQELVNLQQDKSGNAKGYQVKQVRGLVEKYGLELIEE